VLFSPLLVLLIRGVLRRSFLWKRTCSEFPSHVTPHPPFFKDERKKKRRVICVSSFFSPLEVICKGRFLLLPLYKGWGSLPSERKGKTFLPPSPLFFFGSLEGYEVPFPPFSRINEGFLPFFFEF